MSRTQSTAGRGGQVVVNGRLLKHTHSDSYTAVATGLLPVSGTQGTAGRGGQVVVNGRLLKHTQRLIHSCGYWFTAGEWDTGYSWAGRTGSRQRSASETHTVTHTQLWLLVY